MMVISRDDLELLNAVGWTVVVANGNTTIQKEGGNLIDNQDDIRMIIAEENINQKKSLSELFSIYIIVGLFLLFLIFLGCHLF
jgi:hypothetical protein